MLITPVCHTQAIARVQAQKVKLLKHGEASLYVATMRVMKPHGYVVLAVTWRAGPINLCRLVLGLRPHTLCASGTTPVSREALGQALLLSSGQPEPMPLEGTKEGPSWTCSTHSYSPISWIPVLGCGHSLARINLVLILFYEVFLQQESITFSSVFPVPSSCSVISFLHLLLMISFKRRHRV